MEISELQIARLDVCPGDVVVMKIAHRLSHETAGRIRDQMRDVFPAGVRLLLIDDDVELSILSKAEIEARL